MPGGHARFWPPASPFSPGLAYPDPIR